MLAKDVMTRQVISVEPEATILQGIRLMLQNHISGLPVVNANGELVGLVSEGDLLRRGELGTQRRRPRWLEFLVGPGRMATEYVHASGRKIHEVMTTNVLTIDENATLDTVVELMERNHIKRVPIVRDGKIVGLITRANLLHALASVAHEVRPASATDQSIRASLVAVLEQQPWAPVRLIDIVVRDGIVGLWGVITDERQREALIVAAENTNGVKGVEDHLAWIEPNSGMVIEPPETHAKAS